MEKIIYITVVSLLFTLYCFCQDRRDASFIKKDTVKVTEPPKNINENYLHEFLLRQNLFRRSSFFQYYNPKIYNELKGEAGIYLQRHYLLIKEDPLCYYKNYLTKFLSLQYMGFNKYDLGMVGSYLGMSKKAFAIILAILSVE